MLLDEQIFIGTCSRERLAGISKKCGNIQFTYDSCLNSIFYAPNEINLHAACFYYSITTLKYFSNSELNI